MIPGRPGKLSERLLTCKKEWFKEFWIEMFSQWKEAIIYRNQKPKYDI